MISSIVIYYNNAHICKHTCISLKSDTLDALQPKDTFGQFLYKIHDSTNICLQQMTSSDSSTQSFVPSQTSSVEMQESPEAHANRNDSLQSR